MLIAGEELAQQVKFVNHAASRDESRGNLRGVHFTTKDAPGSIRVVASDGHRLAMATWPLERECARVTCFWSPETVAAVELIAYPVELETLTALPVSDFEFPSSYAALLPSAAGMYSITAPAYVWLDQARAMRAQVNAAISQQREALHARYVPAAAAHKEAVAARRAAESELCKIPPRRRSVAHAEREFALGKIDEATRDLWIERVRAYNAATKRAAAARAAVKDLTWTGPRELCAVLTPDGSDRVTLRVVASKFGLDLAAPMQDGRDTLSSRPSPITSDNPCGISLRKIGVNFNYWLAGLKAIAADGYGERHHVTWHVTEPLSPMMLTCGDRTVVIMPMRL